MKKVMVAAVGFLAFVVTIIVSCMMTGCINTRATLTTEKGEAFNLNRTTLLNSTEFKECAFNPETKSFSIKGYASDVNAEILASIMDLAFQAATSRSLGLAEAAAAKAQTKALSTKVQALADDCESGNCTVDPSTLKALLE